MTPISFRRLLLPSAMALLVSCNAPEPVLVPPPAKAGDDTIVVLVPGITGVQLKDKASGTLLWGNGKRILGPRDGGSSLAVPLSAAPEDDANRVEATALIREIRFLGLRKLIYGPVLDLLAKTRRLGDLRSPDPEDSLFSFSYDWRQDNIASARKLAKLLIGVRDQRPGKTLAVNLVCQSNGAHICRYLAKYGKATLEEAEAGLGRPPPGLEIRKIVFVGTANGGSLRILREMNRGRQYVAPFGRTLHPEVLFTFTSLYQELPAYRSRYFVGQDGEPLDVDLYDPDSWERYGWSIYGKKARKRLESAPASVFGTARQRRELLERNLATARRIQALLHKDAPGFGSTRYYLIQNVFKETPDRALLVREEGEWTTYFTGDRRVKKGYLYSVTAAPGDGHAAQDSQMWLSPQELKALAAEPHTVPDSHFEMILHPSAKRRLLEFLAD